MHLDYGPSLDKMVTKLYYCSMRYKKEIYLFIGFLFANVFMLVNNGIFWDDWTVYNMEKAGLVEQFGENGYGFMVYVHLLLNWGTYSPLVYHWLMFFFLFGAYAFVYRILKQFSINEESAFLIALLAMWAPYFETRNLLILLPYTFLLFFFCSGLFLVFEYYLERRSTKSLAGGILLLFLSFFLNSLIPMYLFVYVLFVVSANRFSLALFKRMGRREIILHVGMLALPFVFWGFKKIFFPIKGAYASSGYNAIDLSLKELPKKFETVLTNNVIGVYDELVLVFHRDLHFGIWLMAICALVCALVLKRASFEARRDSRVLRYAVVGFLLFLVGAFPYVVVGKLPDYYGYDTRHQILLSIGLALFTYALVLVFPLYLRRTVCSIFLTVFLFTTVAGNIHFLRGWLKLEAIEHDIKKLDLGEKGGIVYTKGFNGWIYATRRLINSYELSGIFKKALGRQDFYFLYRGHPEGKGELAPSMHPTKFNRKSYKTSKFSDARTLNLRFNIQYIGYLDVMRFTELYYTDRDLFETKVDSMLTVEMKQGYHK